MNLQDLKYGNRYLIDIGSTIDLFGEDTEQFLRGAGGNWQQAIWLWNEKDKSLPLETARLTAWENVSHAAGKNVRKAVELLVVCENLGFDETLSKSSRLHGLDLSVSFPGNEGILQPVEMPDSTRRETADYLRDFSGDLSSFYEKSELSHPEDKIIHDFWKSIDPLTSLAESKEHPLRAVFYMRLSETAKVPVVISESKLEYLDDLQSKGRKVLRGVADLNEEFKDRLMPKNIQKNEVLPPIFETVVRHALDREISPGQAVLNIRNSPEASAYREKLV